jgi:hypothetical protein
MLMTGAGLSSVAASPRSNPSVARSRSARSHYFVNLTNNAAKLTVNLGADFDVFA